jgi:Ca2+-binding EF-hand superfamily protein
LRIHTEAAARHLDTDIDARPAEILDTFTGRAMVTGFYRSIRVLGALDLNHDLVLSADEIANAPKALRSLDRNHDGALQEAECVRQTPRLEADPMHSSPALAALDLNHDRILSASEIRRAASSLKLLDKDHNGRLTPEELLSVDQLRKIREALQQ